MRAPIALFLACLAATHSGASAAPSRRCLSSAMRCCTAPAPLAPARLSCAACCRITVTPAVPAAAPGLTAPGPDTPLPTLIPGGAEAGAAAPPRSVPRVVITGPRAGPLWLANLSLLV